MKRDVILIGSHLGRMGTSAMMGLLKISGANVGGSMSGLHGGDFKNPKGHFEIPRIQNNFFRGKVKCFGPKIVEPPTMEQFEEIGDTWKTDFDKIINEEFSENGKIAMKALRYYAFILFKKLDFKYNIKIIKMSRETNEHAASIHRVWKHNKPNDKTRNFKFFIEVVKKWEQFEKDLYQYHPDIAHIEVNFNDLVNNPVLVCNNVCNFTGLKMPTNQRIRNWIDPKLVNRKKI